MKSPSLLLLVAVTHHPLNNATLAFGAVPGSLPLQVCLNGPGVPHVHGPQAFYMHNAPSHDDLVHLAAVALVICRGGQD